MVSDETKDTNLNDILLRLNSLEERIVALESNQVRIRHSNIARGRAVEDEDKNDVTLGISSGSLLESNLGEYGLAWLGNVVLFFAIAFICQYFNNTGKPIVSIIIGGISVISVFAFSHFSRKNYTYLSYMFSLFGFILLFYLVLRLHFYNDKPIITSELIATLSMLVVVGFQLFRAFTKQSQVLATLAFTLALITAFVSSQTHTFFLISVATSGLVLYLFWNRNWWKSLIFILFLTHFVYLIWILKNHVTLFKSPEDLTYYYVFIYLSATTAIYSFVVFRKQNEKYPEYFTLFTILSAGIAYSILLLILVFMNISREHISIFSSISIYCIIFSIILKFYSPWRYAPALYALFGFVGLSIAVYTIYQFPASFLLLVYQSFLVLILALWYRSHIITLINTFLLLLLVLVYYKLSGTLQIVNFSIPFVAFLSARIINWQKERLNIKTDFIRNLYLFILFFSLLYATAKGLPSQYITISWLLISGVYFGLSIILKNIKYRWLAMANLLVSAIYLFLVDFSKMDIVFRILAFLVFAVVSIAISSYYVRKLKKKEDENS